MASLRRLGIGVSMILLLGFSAWFGTCAGAATCSNGVPGVQSDFFEDICCAAGCLQCGGDGCEDVARLVGLGGDDCCNSEIRDNDDDCATTGEGPCVIVGAVTCSNGVPGVQSDLFEDICCTLGCLQCGGDGCEDVASLYGLGADDCCDSEIRDNDDDCATTGEGPCVTVDGTSGHAMVVDTPGPTTIAYTPGPMGIVDTPDDERMALSSTSGNSDSSSDGGLLGALLTAIFFCCIGACIYRKCCGRDSYRGPTVVSLPQPTIHEVRVVTVNQQPPVIMQAPPAPAQQQTISYPQLTVQEIDEDVGRSLDPVSAEVAASPVSSPSLPDMGLREGPDARNQIVTVDDEGNLEVQTFTNSDDFLRAMCLSSARRVGIDAQKLITQGKFADADTLFSRGVTLFESAGRREHPELATFLNNWGISSGKQGKYDEADSLFLRAIEIGEKSLDPGHPELSLFLKNRAALLEAQARHLDLEVVQPPALPAHDANTDTDCVAQLAVYAPPAPPAHDANTDRAALLALYEAAGGPASGTSEGWGRDNNRGWGTSLPIGEWYGVEVDDKGRVHELEMWFTSGFRGVIPKELGQLTALQDLILKQNKIIGPIPKEIGQLAALTSLDLAWNQLDGPIPKEIGQLRALKFLDLERNQLDGPIPKEIGQLTNLTQLRLQRNKISGPIPKEIGQMTSLTYLDLQENRLSGPIPKEIGQLTAMNTMYLCNNNLSGRLPEELGQLRVLKCIWLNGNISLIGSKADLTRLLPNCVEAFFHLKDVRLL